MGPEKQAGRSGPDAETKQTKRRSSMNIFKVAVYMMRKGKSNKPSMHSEVASKGLWRKLLGATKPQLQLEDKKPSLLPHPPAKAAAVVPEDEQQHRSSTLSNVKNTFAEAKTVSPVLTGSEKCEELLHPQSSPSCSSSASYEESRYASAMNLRELDVCEEEEDDDDEECQFDDSAGDSMIDIKAELFIAQFYEQMRLQNSQTAPYQMLRG